MDLSYRHLRRALSKGAVAMVFAAGVAFAGALVAAPAYAVTVDFSSDSVDGFTLDGLKIDNSANCPGVAPCDHVNNENSTLTISKEVGIFDLTSFAYNFNSDNGNLIVSSNLSDLMDAATYITLSAILDTGIYTVAGDMLAFFTGVTSIQFSSDTQANVRIDDIALNVAAVPVPAGIVLGASGLGLLGLLGWRRKRPAGA